VIPQIRSFYHWKGAIEPLEECCSHQISRELFDAVRARLEAAHSYESPGTAGLPVVEGAANYMNWLDALRAEEVGE